MDEQWRPILKPNIRLVSGESKYEVSNMGNVRRVEYIDVCGRLHSVRVLKLIPMKDGCITVYLHDATGQSYRPCVHKLVAEAFIPNPFGMKSVGHLNDDFANNCVSNLEWGSGHRFRLKDGNGVVRTRGKHVRQYTVNGEFVAEYSSVSDACRKVYLSGCSQLSQCCNRLPGHHTCAGFIWRFADDDELYDRVK